MSRAGVLGSPIAHSLSPVLHRAAYAALELNWTYDAIDCGAADLAGVVAARADWAGFSCTMPLKRAALDLAATVSPIAAAVGSANTLLPGADGWIADNTDVGGIVAALREHRVLPAQVTVLGGGGTAQAVLGALAEIGIGGCTVLVRDPARVDAVLGTAQRFGLEVQARALDDAQNALAAQLVVSTLPAGAGDPMADRAWSAEQAVFDVVYAEWPTPLARAAAAGGATVISGAVMLLHQAAGQVELMTGLAAPVQAMRAALRTAAPGCGA